MLQRNEEEGEEGEEEGKGGKHYRSQTRKGSYLDTVLADSSCRFHFYCLKYEVKISKHLRCSASTLQ